MSQPAAPRGAIPTTRAPFVCRNHQSLIQREGCLTAHSRSSQHIGCPVPVFRVPKADSGNFRRLRSCITRGSYSLSSGARSDHFAPIRAEPPLKSPEARADSIRLETPHAIRSALYVLPFVQFRCRARRAVRDQNFRAGLGKCFENLSPHIGWRFPEFLGVHLHDLGDKAHASQSIFKMTPFSC